MSHLIRFFIVVLILTAVRTPAQPAFPGAEGAGANAKGGRGGDVYFVTNLNNTGAGSLRNGITSANGPRTIIFRVSGNIDLSSNLSINKPYLTIAGQTAPGDGITLRRRLVSVQNTHDVIVRFIRCRAGDLDSSFEDDSFHTVRVRDVMVDHVSASWSVDECLSVTWSTNVTVQWCLISESLLNSQHEKGAHGYGALLRYGDGSVTYHHNLFQHHSSRNPRLGDRIKLDFVNNVLYNWGGTAGYSGGNGPTEDAKDNPGGVFTNHLNYIGNYLVAGPNSGSRNTAFKSGATNTVIYQSSNRIDPNRNSVLDGTDTGWGMFNGYLYTPSPTPFPIPPVDADSAEVAYARVLALAGASHVRDSVDTRLIGTVRNQNGGFVDAVGPSDQAADYVINNVDGTDYVFVRGWPTLNSTAPPADFDNDGMPDYWELALGKSTNAPNNNHTNADGYTDLENYLNWLAEPHVVCDRNGAMEVDLRGFIGVTNGFTFTVADGTNGNATLLPDGYTARFVANSDYNGLASFSFDATETTTGIGFGPVAVGVLVSVTNAPVLNTPPVLAAISNQTVIAGSTIQFTASATDTDAPPQNLTFAVENAPPGATLDPDDGLFDWRPLIAQSETTNTMNVIVADDGSPSLSATQQFSVTVLRPAPPAFQEISLGSGVEFQFNGDAGPDYTVQASTNLLDWFDIFTTNSPALPFTWSDPDAGGFDWRFYRVLLGP